MWASISETAKCAEFEDADPIVSALSPVPGGVGAVTTAVLISHITDAAKKLIK